MSTFPVPPGLVQVTQEQFYEALYADKRDIMPNLDSDSFSDCAVNRPSLADVG